MCIFKDTHVFIEIDGEKLAHTVTGGLSKVHTADRPAGNSRQGFCASLGRCLFHRGYLDLADEPTHTIKGDLLKVS